MSTPATSTCATCTYNNLSACHRYPPTVGVFPAPGRTTTPEGVDIRAISLWPSVKAEQFCGEWAPRRHLMS